MYSGITCGLLKANQFELVKPRITNYNHILYCLYSACMKLITAGKLFNLNNELY